MRSSTLAADVAVPAVPVVRTMWPGLLLALLGSIAFSGKAIIVKLAYRHGIDAISTRPAAAAGSMTA